MKYVLQLLEYQSACALDICILDVCHFNHVINVVVVVAAAAVAVVVVVVAQCFNMSTLKFV